MAETNVRLIAVRIMTSLVRDGKSLAELLPAAQEQLEVRDAAFLQQLTFGACRTSGWLEAIVTQLLKKPLRNKDTDVRMIIWLALYELGYMRTPDYAVTNSYVDLTKKIKKTWAKGLINATQRQFLRDKQSLTEKAKQISPYALPGWIESTVRKDWPDQADGLFDALNSRAPLTLRVNTRVTDRDRLMKKLADAGLDSETCQFVSTGIRLIEAPAVTSLPGFAEGEFSVQDQSAQLAAPLLDPKPGERVLDACAAPGGKSCHLLELQPELELHCLDENPERLKRVKQNLTRLDLQANIICADAADPNSWWDNKPYDAVLLDAPCSALGVLRRHPDIRLLRRQSDLRDLSQRQLGLMQSVWPLLKPGGRLIYATCSVLKRENEDCVGRFMEQMPDVSETQISADWGVAVSHGRQILPGQDQADGFYYAVLHKQ